jgi:hypothetical protein
MLRVFFSLRQRKNNKSNKAGLFQSADYTTLTDDIVKWPTLTNSITVFAISLFFVSFILFVFFTLPFQRLVILNPNYKKN